MPVKPPVVIDVVPSWLLIRPASTFDVPDLPCDFLRSCAPDWNRA